MRALVQRVIESRVVVNHQIVGQIQQGLLVFVGIGKSDGMEDIKWMANKITHLRVFNDEHNKMNKSVMDINGELLIVSQFTLYGDAHKGHRPSFVESAPPDRAKIWYEALISECERILNKPVQRGIFAADMKVYLVNDGPVTIWLESKRW